MPEASHFNLSWLDSDSAVKNFILHSGLMQKLMQCIRFEAQLQFILKLDSKAAARCEKLLPLDSKTILHFILRMSHEITKFKELQSFHSLDSTIVAKNFNSLFLKK